MLKIVEQTDLAAYDSLLKKIRASGKLYLTEALDGDAVIGLIVYAYDPDQVVIYHVEDGGDLHLCDGLVRSVLFKAELRGIERALFALTDEGMMGRMRTLRFVQNNENLLDKIHLIMENCEKCSKNTINT